MCLCLTHPSIWRIALFGRLWLVAVADFLSEKSTAGWLVADADLVWEKITAGCLAWNLEALIFFSINKAVQTPYFPELLTKYSGLIIHGCVMLRRQDYLYCYENNVLNRSICAFPGTTILFHCCVLKAADLWSSLYLHSCPKQTITTFSLYLNQYVLHWFHQ